MYEAFITAASGLKNQQRRIDTIADNIANIDTNGFKASRVDFKDALYTAGMYAHSNTAENQQKGHGVMTAAITRNWETGALTVTGNNLDFAINGDGFFQIEAANGEKQYCRSGNLYITNMNDGLYLVTSHGHFVLDSSGEPLVLPENTDKIEVSTSGEITFSDAEGSIIETNNFGIYTFDNKSGLSSIGNGFYLASENSGEAEAAEEFEVRQGALEASNVELSLEITRLIRTQRAFTLAGKALTTADDMEGLANNMRK